MSKRIHVLINGEPFGPYPEVEFRQHVADRKILHSDLVWREGLADWIPAGDLLKLETSAAVPAPKAKSLFEETKEAAERGEAQAQFRLAMMYEKGEGAPLSHVEAAKWLRKAAEQRHAGAQFQLSLA